MRKLFVLFPMACALFAADPMAVIRQTADLQQEGRHPEAIALLNQLISTTPDLAIPVRALAWNDVAMAHQVLDHHQEAEMAYRKALVLLEDRKDQPLLKVRVRMNYVCLLIESGRAREAAKIWTLDDLRQLRDPGDMNLAWGLLASIALATGRMDKAEQIYLNNLADLRRRNDTAFAPALATTLNNLGTLSLRRKRWAQAEQWLNQALEVWSIAVGHQHPCRVKTLANLGYAQMKQKSWDAAAATFREALSLSPPHSLIADALRDNWSEFLAAAPARVRTAVVQASTATASTPRGQSLQPAGNSPLREH